jgi:hypothetical protein
METLLKAVEMKIVIFWDVTPCSLISSWPKFVKNLLPSSFAEKE